MVVLANVQVEKGYTKIANRLYDEILKTSLTGSQIKVVFAIIRYTYGFNKKSGDISYSFIAKATNISQRQVADTLKSLKDMNIVFVTDNGKGKTNTLSINKNFDSWGLGYEVGFSSEAEFIGGMNCTSLEVMNCTSYNKEKKKYINKNSANAHFENIWSMYPCKKGKGQVSDSKKKELSKITPEEWERIIHRYKMSIEYDRANGFNKQYQNGSTFFNSGYIDYTDENYADAKITEDTWKGYDAL